MLILKNIGVDIQFCNKSLQEKSSNRNQFLDTFAIITKLKTILETKKNWFLN